MKLEDKLQHLQTQLLIVKSPKKLALIREQITATQYQLWRLRVRERATAGRVRRKDMAE